MSLAEEYQEESPWFKVPLAPGQPKAQSTDPVILFHSLSNTSSATAAIIIRKYQEKMGHSGAPTLSTLLEDPESPEGLEINRIFGPHIQVTWENKSKKTTAAWSHGLFGIHQVMKQPYQYITFLRDPRMTYISRLFYWKVVKNVQELEQYVAGQYDCNLFCQDLARMFTHIGEQTFCISPHYSEPKPTSEQALTLAIQNIEKHFSFIGIAEYFNESLFMLSRHLGYPEIHLWERQCATRGRPELSDIPPHVIERIEYIVAADMILYDLCKNYFLSELQKADLGEDLQRYNRAMEYTDHPSRRLYHF
jgi:hypothetical protein